ncbi:MAG: hypothetical protein GY947_06375 [Rhodobacteraceae bacterium]|nr:hypothetical protein [Paracoccaceae bacterium]
MLNIVRRIVKRRKVTSVEDNLKFYIGISESLVALGFFGLIFKEKLNLRDYFGAEGVSIARLADATFWESSEVFLSQQWAALVFALFILFWYFMYRVAVKSEMEILVSLYSRINPPHDWQKTLGQRMIPLLSVGLTLAFLGLALSMDRLELFCIIMLLLNIQDALGNNLIRKNLLRHFHDEDYLPHPSDLHAPFIMERR